MSNRPETPSVYPTRDGSTTLYSSRFKQHYHNPNGAVAESRYVFFETPGTLQALENRSEINILEVGFGTGLNLILLLDYLQRRAPETRVTFHSIEAFPIDPEVASALDFGKEFRLHTPSPSERLQNIFRESHAGMNTFNPDERVQLNLFIGFFDEYIRWLAKSAEKAIRFDFIFHDPFSPEVNADLWTPGVFRDLAALSHPEAILSTYCAASSARTAMAVAGWKPARASGALGKREMTIAALSGKELDRFKPVNEKRLIDRFKAGDFG